MTCMCASKAARHTFCLRGGGGSMSDVEMRPPAVEFHDRLGFIRAIELLKPLVPPGATGWLASPTCSGDLLASSPPDHAPMSGEESEDKQVRQQTQQTQNERPFCNVRGFAGLCFMFYILCFILYVVCVCVCVCVHARARRKRLTWRR